MSKGEIIGQLYFSDEWPETFVGDLGPYEITGHRVSKIRATIKARRRDGKPVQEDMFDERAADADKKNESEFEGQSERSGDRKSCAGTDPGATHENKLV